MDVNVRDVLKTSVINEKNKHKYEVLRKIIDSCPDEQVVLDFSMIIVDAKGEALADIVTDNKTFLIIKNDKDFYGYVRTLCTILGIDVSKKCKFTQDAAPVVQDKTAVKIEETYHKMRSILEDADDGFKVLKLRKMYSNCGENTYIVASILKVCDEYSNTGIIVDLCNVNFNKEKLEKLIKEIISRVQNKSSKIKVLSDNYKNEIETIAEISGSGVNTTSDKMMYLDNNVAPGTVGILSKFSSRKSDKDMFGRGGNGQPKVSLPALYIKHDDKYAYFKRYKHAEFKRRYDYYALNEEEHPGLKYEIIKCPLSELGIYATCIGTSWQFTLPVQNDENNMVPTSWFDGERTHSSLVTLPQYIMMVLNEFHEKYNIAELQECIAISKKILREKGVKFNR